MFKDKLLIPLKTLLPLLPSVGLDVMICHSACSLDPLIILGRCSVLSHLVKSYYLSEYVTEPAIFFFHLSK